MTDSPGDSGSGSHIFTGELMRSHGLGPAWNGEMPSAPATSRAPRPGDLLHAVGWSREPGASGDDRKLAAVIGEATVLPARAVFGRGLSVVFEPDGSARLDGYTASPPLPELRRGDTMVLAVLHGELSDGTRAMDVEVRRGSEWSATKHLLVPDAAE